MEFKIEKMANEDWVQVRFILLEGISTGISTFESDPPSGTFEDWSKGHIFDLVAKDGSNVLGWIGAWRTSQRECYSGVAEIGIFIGQKYRRCGVGNHLLDKAIKASEEMGIWTLQSVIISENIASILLHEKCGFRKVGFREKIGKMKNNVWHDTVLMEKRSDNIEAGALL